MLLQVNFSVLCTLFCFAGVIAREHDEEPEVTVSNGKLQGRYQVSREGLRFASFEGIPYAKAQRFMPPEPAANWTGAKDARKTATPCPQVEPINGRLFLDEDCLFLNVYVPPIKIGENLPVMVWIHGGGFRDGSGAWAGPDYFMDQGVILVTINYRLGAFGFLNTGDGLVTGNMGLKDQIMSLRWVQQNIASFGGDKAAVTIFGESAGGASVHLLMLSPAAKGLFSKVISQSGCGLDHWSYDPKPKDHTEDMAKAAKCFGDTKTMLQCLLKSSVQEILTATNTLPGIPFAPTIDSGSPDAVLPDTPLNLIKRYSKQNSVNVPLVIGFNQEEGLVFAYVFTENPAVVAAINLYWNQQIPKLLGYDVFYEGRKEEMDRVSRGLKKFYLNNMFLSRDTMPRFVHMFSDVYMILGIKRAAVLHAQTNVNVYPYELRYRGNFSIADMIVPPEAKPHPPTHADDLQYLFNSLLGPVQNWPDLFPASKDEAFSKEVVGLWSQFAKTGVPDPTWEPIPLGTSADARLTWFALQDPPAEYVEDLELHERLTFLNHLFDDSLLKMEICRK